MSSEQKASAESLIRTSRSDLEQRKRALDDATSSVRAIPNRTHHTQLRPDRETGEPAFGFRLSREVSNGFERLINEVPDC